MAKKPIGIFNSPLFGKVKKQNDWQGEYDAIVAAQRSQPAHILLDRAFELYERYPTTHDVQNLAATLLAQVGYKPKALELWQAIVNKDFQILTNIAMVRMELGYLDQTTEQYFLDALAKNPTHTDTLYYYGMFKERTYQFIEAATIYKKLVEINPSYPSGMTNLLFSQNFIYPLPLQKIYDCSLQFAKLLSPKQIIKQNKPHQIDKSLHIGIICADLRKHPVGYFFESLISAKPSRQFSWTVFANNETHDELSERISEHTVRWYKNVSGWSDEKIINQIQQDNVDILLDLTGYTGKHRLSVYAQQAAPVQITWLGYWGTTGLPTMQAVIADAHCVHDGEEKWFTEKVYRMPHSRLCMMPPKVEIQPNTLPALKNHFPTFGCFQKLKKINDDVLTLWGKIAKKLPQAKWVFQSLYLSDDTSIQNFKQRLIDFGFSESQFELIGKTSREDYFSNYHKVDLILDVFPYTGGTTTTEALWMGVPTITLTSEGMIARQGEQLLSAAGLPDWVCQTEEEYIEKALYWANPANFDKLNTLRQNLRQQVLASPLFDTEQFAEDWCKLVRQIWIDECERQK